jgi:hypothetical protein
MNLILEFHPEAAAEVQCIVGDYEAKVPGLGVRFRHEIEDACSAIVQHPLLWTGEPARFPLLLGLHSPG